MQVSIRKSSRAGKKWMARVNDTTIHFGARGYEDFTTHETKSVKPLIWPGIERPKTGNWAAWKQRGSGRAGCYGTSPHYPPASQM